MRWNAKITLSQPLPTEIRSDVTRATSNPVLEQKRETLLLLQASNGAALDHF